MIDMKLTPDQAPSYGSLLGGETNEGPAYPEGLKIELEGEALKRLAIGTSNMPQVGQKLMLTAVCEVVEVCKEDQQIETGYCIELQIQQMELGNEQQRAQDQIEALYKS